MTYDCLEMIPGVAPDFDWMRPGLCLHFYWWPERGGQIENQDERCGAKVQAVEPEEADLEWRVGESEAEDCH